MAQGRTTFTVFGFVPGRFGLFLLTLRENTAGTGRDASLSIGVAHITLAYSLGMITLRPR